MSSIPNRPSLVRLLPLGLLVGILSACGSSQPQARGPHFTTTHVRIVQNTGPKPGPDALYQPSPVVVHLGQTISWTNDDQDIHDVTSEDAGFFSPHLAYHGSFSWKPTRTGKFRYTCTVHPGMYGVIIVKR